LVVILADLQEFSYKEIAEILSCPVGTVMSRLFRGRKLLQKNLRDYALGQGVLHPDNEQKSPGTTSLDEYRSRKKLG
ncbi:MAG: sigma factor-like helix-turn-helix DNA-binding protein, partial [Myxococcaceae bacterium]